MNLGVAGTTFLLVIPAELPDKTFISTVLLSSRNRPLPVWCGAGLALTLQAAIAVVAGRLIELLPHNVVQGVVAALFIAGAAFLVFVPEKREQEEAEKLAAKEERALEAGEAPLAETPGAGTPGAGTPGAGTPGAGTPGAGTPPAGGRSILPARSSWRVFLTTFAIIAVAEFGDLTQILIANLTAHYRDPWGVFVGATVGFWLVAGIGVLAGKTITRVVPLGVVRRISGLILLGFGIWSIVELI